LDSHQARLISLAFLKDRGLERDKDFTVKRFNPTVGNGKNGDFISGDMNALKAVQRGQADASAMLDLNWDTWTKNGAINPSDYRFLATSEKSDHCVFALRQDFPRDVEQKWLKALFSMSYYNPKHREMIKLEGLTKWLPGRTSSFEPLVDAAKKLGYFEGHKI
ncbi:MAG: phosphonate ABC transporter substrate-binding protein, partial [SAR202 cluster bacterium]|nr:phosphonate ABC transporter substrate-binding protein [SAR202 cluster bacterium]